MGDDKTQENTTHKGPALSQLVTYKAARSRKDKNKDNRKT